MNGFYWIERGRLAGFPRPGAWRDLDRDLSFLAAQGIRLVVTAMPEPLDPAALARHGLVGLHLPVPDYHAPTRAQVAWFLKAVEKANGDGNAAGVHCFAGMGRTGTLAACWLVHAGRSAGDALDEVRRLRPGSVESAEQEDLVWEAEGWGEKRGVGEIRGS